MERMRLTVIAALLCGCGPDHFGTYFIADGRPAAIDFDRAEFFFGSKIDGDFASLTGARSGDVYRRMFVDNDEAVPATDRRSSYYLPTDGATNVGSYVLVLARNSSDAVVGVAEASGFSLATSNEVIEVHLPLEPPDNVETWGASPSCVAWAQRGGQATTAVVRDDDRDCDGALATNDCNDLAYCAAGDPSCSTAPTLCLATCSLGCRANNACEASVCLPAAACPTNGTCGAASSVAERLACIADQSAHIKVAVMDTGRPCVDSFVVPLPSGSRCGNPIIEYAEPLPDGYTFEVTDGATSCGISIKKPSSAASFSGIHHLLISIDAPSGVGPRPTLFLGIDGFQRVPIATCTGPVTIEQIVINRC